MIFSGCPGADRLKSPTIEERECPQCGNMIEIFSIDTEVPCENCGFVAYNDTLSCASWCQYAEKCLGSELYTRLVESGLIKPVQKKVKANV